ncbi:MAG: polysaccharide export protein [Gammaproteobacteria bacterium]|nr:polysaccharide export protein [Gammaproteobacteria bacterium]
MFRFISVFLLSLSLLSITAVSVAAEKQRYRIGPGDLLSINVFGEDDLSLKEIRVGTNGTISFPLLGEVSVRNMSAQTLESNLIRMLKDGYLKKPVVTVSVIEYRLFYINGEVKKPGGYNFVDGLTIQKAVALAGGFTERASKDKITIERETEPGKVKKAGLNNAVNPGDVITVDESFF